MTTPLTRHADDARNRRATRPRRCLVAAEVRVRLLRVQQNERREREHARDEWPGDRPVAEADRAGREDRRCDLQHEHDRRENPGDLAAMNRPAETSSVTMPMMRPAIESNVGPLEMSRSSAPIVPTTPLIRTMIATTVTPVGRVRAMRRSFDSGGLTRRAYRVAADRSRDTATRSRTAGSHVSARSHGRPKRSAK